MLGCGWEGERRECKSTSGVCRQNTRVNNIHLPISDCLVTMMHKSGERQKLQRKCEQEVSISEAMDLNFFSSSFNYCMLSLLCMYVCVCFPPLI